MCEKVTGNPKYGRGELPIEYTPLTEHSLKSGDRFGPLAFQISDSSHKHHLEFIAKCVGEGAAVVGSDSLYPFEFWPLPRVLSQWRFGRLNEVISVRAQRTVMVCPKADQRLLGQTSVRSVTMQNGLCFGFFQSITKLPNGDPCMTAEDVLLLVNGCDPDKLREIVAQAVANMSLISVTDQELTDQKSFLKSWSLRMRYTWPQTKWKNNIHTDVYARALGYERALVEGPGVADVVYAYDAARFGLPQKFRLSWKYLAPLYETTKVLLARQRSSNEKSRRYSVCEFPSRIPPNYRALLDVALEVT